MTRNTVHLAKLQPGRYWYYFTKLIVGIAKIQVVAYFIVNPTEIRVYFL